MTIPVDQFGLFGPDPINGRWCKPPPGYLKLNVDGSFRDGRATFAGVLRDHRGVWMWGFTGVSHVSSSLAAELHALSQGLMLLIQRHAFRTLIEPDSSEAINLLHDYVEPEHPLSAQLVTCKSLHRQLWSSPVFWTVRSCNMLADGLAKFGHMLGDSPCFVFFDSCPPQLEELLLQDTIM